MAEIGVMKKLTIGGSTYTIPEYNLPIASASTLGGVKIGTGLSINSTTGVLSATGLDYDEADPVFVASAAYGITQNDISNWNSKTSNIGTITSVKTTAGAHTAINVTSGAAAFNVPTKTSHLTNDSGFLTSYTDENVKNIAITDETTIYLVGSTNDSTTTGSLSKHASAQLKFSADSHTSGQAALYLGNNLMSGATAGAKRGQIYLYGNGYYYTLLQTAATLNRTITLPDKTGTVALTSDIPDVSSFLTSETDPTVPAWAKASSKPSYTFSEIGSKPTTLSGYGITDAYTKTEVNGLVSGVLHYKGTKATVADVAAITSKSIGDVWHVTADGSEWAYDGSAWQELGTSIDLSNYVTHGNTGSATTGITATTTATKTTLGTATSVTGVSGSTTASKASGSNGSASNWVFEDVACDDITAWSAGSGSASLTFTMDTTDTKKLKISFSHTHTAPSLTYSAKTASHVKSGGNGTAPSWSFTDVTVPKAAASATSIPNVSVTSATVSITDNGHTHTI